MRVFDMIPQAIVLRNRNEAGDTMTEATKLHFAKGDWLAIGLVVIMAVAVMLCFLPGKTASAAYAEVYLDGELYKTVPLAENTVFWITDQYSNEITVANGTVAFTASDCPGQDCVHSGSIRSTGRSLVCLPNRVEIRVVSGVGDVDFVVG